MSTITGIYKIENKINGYCYIGQSTDILRRWRNHKTIANNENHEDKEYPLYRAIRKYGIDNFDFSILEECKVEELNDKEVYWIKQYNSFFNGYNQTIGGNQGKSFSNKEQIVGIIHDLETTDMLHKEIADKWGLSVEIVQGINTGRYWKHRENYPIQRPHPTFKKNGKIIKHINKPDGTWFCVDCGKPISRGSKRCNSCENKRRAQKREIEINREDLKNKIRIQSFTSIAKEYKVTHTTISRWCEKYNLPNRKSLIKKISDEDWINI